MVAVHCGYVKHAAVFLVHFLCTLPLKPLLSVAEEASTPAQTLSPAAQSLALELLQDFLDHPHDLSKLIGFVHSCC